jgi:hypothetical protein
MNGPLQIRPQPKEPRRLRHQLRPKLFPPHRMGKIASTYNTDAFAPCPPGKVFEVAVATAGPGEFGVYVEVRVEAHRPIMP